MGYAMAERLAKGGCDIAVWNRTRKKAEPLAKYGAKVVNQLEELSTRDILFVMVSTYQDVKEVIGKALAGRGKPKMVVECSSISLDGSASPTSPIWTTWALRLPACPWRTCSITSC